MTRYVVSLDWFNGDDTDEIEVEAGDLDAAARVVWDEWAPTGWTGASLREGRRYLNLDLEARSFDEGVRDSAKPERGPS